MRWHLLILIGIMVVACEDKQPHRQRTHELKVVEARLISVPSDSIKPPNVYSMGDVTLRKFPIVKSSFVQKKSNTLEAGDPLVSQAGKPRVCSPGMGSCEIPETVLSKDSAIMVGALTRVVAGDMARKEMNPSSVSYFSKLEGLSHDVINCVTEDHYGNLWFGTNTGGATRYDGKYFTHFTTKEGLVNDDVLCMMEDRQGNMWFGTSHGVTKFDGRFIINYSNLEGIIIEGVNSMCEDNSGNIWFGTSRGVVKYDGTVFTNYSELDCFKGFGTFGIYNDTKGNIWFATMGGGITFYDGKTFYTFTEEHGLAGNAVLCIQEDFEGNLWFGTTAGVSRFNGSKFSNYNIDQGLIDNAIGCMEMDHLGNVWFGSQQGICSFDGERFTNYSIESGLTSDYIYSLQVDRSGVMWAGTGGGGVCRIAAGMFTHLLEDDGLINSSVNAMHETKNRERWLGTEDGLVKLSSPTIENFSRPEGTTLRLKTWCFEQDNSGKLWIGIDKSGLIYFDGRDFKEMFINEEISDAFVSCIAEDSSGVMWFGTSGNGVLRYDGKTLIHYTEENGLAHNTVIAIEQDTSGNLWFATEGGGVGVFDGKEWKRVTMKQGLPTEDVDALLLDRRGNMWIGTAKGLCRYDGETICTFTTADGLSSDAILSLWEENTPTGSNLWIGTRMGLCRLRTDLIDNRIRDGGRHVFITDEEVLIKSYDVKDGFLGIGCNRGAMQRFSDGKLWIGANNILTSVNTEYIIDDTLPPVTQIIGVDLFNEEMNWQALMMNDTSFRRNEEWTIEDYSFDSLSAWQSLPMGLKLPHEHNSPTFRFIGVTMHQPWKVKYKYILEGYDDDWSTLTAENFIHYGNLPAGDYNFKVMSMSSSGYWSEPVQFSFTIVPPWWRNWWSFTGYILIGFFSVFSYIRWRERALKIQQKKLQIRIDQATRVIMDQKTEVENQKALVEEQNREILDSIEYAKRIQAAILPPPAEVKEMLKDSFVVYMPKDIVAGDFYWMDSLGEEIYFAACDCTGHGVPGAMVSVVCNYVLNASINEFSIRDPGAIFDKARELLIANFAKSDEDVKDGMDASLCALNISERKLKWCGANNPIWIYRSDEKVMEEIKPDKQPIGKGYEMKPFTTHQLDLKAGDVIYIFTDGYADQFGGEKNKKLTRSRFRDLLLRIAELPMFVQREKLISFHHEYRGKQEQVDDICVIGVRV